MDLLDELGVPPAHPFRARAGEALADAPPGYRDALLLLLPVLWRRPVRRGWLLTYFRASVPLGTDLAPFERRLAALFEPDARARPYINPRPGARAP